MAASNTEIDDTRRAFNFRSVQETIALKQSGVTVLDPYSTLVSPSVDIGEQAIIWPGVTIQCVGDSGTVSIASATILHSGTRIVVSNDGTIKIGASVEIGEEGGFSLKADAGATITIGDGARLLGGRFAYVVERCRPRRTDSRSNPRTGLRSPWWRHSSRSGSRQARSGA